MYLAGIPILIGTFFALYFIQSDLNAAEQRARDEAESVAATALARWNNEAEPRLAQFIAAVEKARSGGPVEFGFKRSDVLSNPGRVDFSSNKLPEIDPVIEAGWFARMPAETRNAWNVSERGAASVQDADALADFWINIARKFTEPGLRAAADFAALRTGIAAGRITNSYEALVHYRENRAWTSPSGIPGPHLVWRELFRLPVRTNDAIRLSPQFLQDTDLEPPTLIVPLLDELERTWAASDPVWKDIVTHLRSDWPDRMRRRSLENWLRRTITSEPRFPVTMLHQGGDAFMLLRRESFTGSPLNIATPSFHLIPLALWEDAVAKVTTRTNPRAFRHFDVWLRFGEMSIPVTANRDLRPGSQPIVVFPPSDDKTLTFVRAAVYMTDRAGFFAEVRRRAFIVSMLVLAAAGGALMGMAQARKSYVRQQDLNEAQANFVSSVSHELRAPLASVRLLAENLERGGDESPERRREYYHLMVRECRRLGTLVQNVLDWSRIERGGQQYDFAPADLAALARETARLMEPQFTERNVRLELQIASDAQSSDGFEAVADAAAIQQALINLLDNALKHSPAGSVVSLSLARIGDQLHFKVTDQGPGIPVDEHERIFDRFHRLGSELRRETAGIGIGLSIVKHIAEAHGGHVRVASTQGHGATFTLDLPKNR